MSDASLGNLKLESEADGKNAGLIQGLYRDFWPELCRYLGATFGSGPPEPEDVAQAAFTNFAALKDPSSVENPRAYLYSTARNIVISYHRRAGTAKRYAQEKNDTSTEDQLFEIDPERVLIARDELSIVERALWRMPRKRRRIVIMNRFDGLSYAEIARQTGLSHTVVRRHVDKALRDFQRALQAERVKDGK